MRSLCVGTQSLYFSEMRKENPATETTLNPGSYEHQIKPITTMTTLPVTTEQWTMRRGGGRSSSRRSTKKRMSRRENKDEEGEEVGGKKERGDGFSLLPGEYLAVGGNTLVVITVHTEGGLWAAQAGSSSPTVWNLDVAQY